MTPHLEELASLYVLDRLDPPERAEFEAQLARDPELQHLVHELEAAAERRIRSLPQYPPPANLLATIEAQLEPTAPPSFQRHAAPIVPFRSVARWTFAAAAAIALGAATFFFLERQRPAPETVVLVVGLDAGRSTVTTVPLPRSDTNQDRFIQLASLAEMYWTQPSQDHATAYALFDPTTHQGFIGVQELPAKSNDRRYRLWVIDAATGKAWDAGVLPLNASPRGLYSFSVDLPSKSALNELTLLLSAEDPESPAPTRPRGEPVLGEKPI